MGVTPIFPHRQPKGEGLRPKANQKETLNSSLQRPWTHLSELVKSNPSIRSKKLSEKPPDKRACRNHSDKIFKQMFRDASIVMPIFILKSFPILETLQDNN